MNMQVLTPASIESYQKLLGHTIGTSMYEMFLHIGVNLVELYPEKQYINVLVQSMVDTSSLDMSDINMRLRQLNNFYNDVIISYESIDLFEPEEQKLKEIEEVLTLMMSYQSDEENKAILTKVLDEVVDVVAREYYFYEEMYDIMSYENLLQHLKEVVFEDFPRLYLSFVSLMDMSQMLKRGADTDEVYVFSIMTMINLAMFNDARKERFEMISSYENEVRQKKIGRNEPCPCGSGKKYKKCCG